MENYEWELETELEYFRKTVSLANAQLEKRMETRADNRNNLLLSRKEMWDTTPHASNDFDSVVEMSQYLDALNIQEFSYFAETNEVQKLQKLQDSPYFARVDFCESGEKEKENIYIGRHSLMDDDTQNMYVFDWRSPIASIFYRYELGKVQYEAPGGMIRGTVSRKRQYEIKQGNFEYFFDANVEIVDEFLRKLLSKNASSKMTNIVETIQKDQDMIIRDSKNDLLMVQGVAGSGKTSVALHRVAYLMYQGLSSKLSSNNIVIISPNALFEKYISNVLPELGENNVETLAFEEICNHVLGKEFQITQTRNQFFEELISCSSSVQKKVMKSSMEFKGSQTFVVMLKRLVTAFERKLIPFSSITYHNKLLFHRNILKAMLFNGNPLIPIAVRLKQMETIILEKVREERKPRILELERFMEKYPHHIYECQAFARMLSIRENKILLSHIHKFTELDYAAIYRKMFHDKNLFYVLSKGLKLPKNIEEIRMQTDKLLCLNYSRYEDILALTFLKIKLAGCNSYKNIKQVVIDEAQDYYPIHFEILNMLVPEAKYTVLGDINQTIEKQTTLGFYDNLQEILDKKSSALLTLSKSFRCTNQIISFSSNFIDKTVKQECFSRDGVPPEVFSGRTQEDLDQQLKVFIDSMKEEGYKSICILCKSLSESVELHERIKYSTNVVLMSDTYITDFSSTIITPIYMAKGLEFDVALIYGTDDGNYQSTDDRKLLYVASTRALHRLALFYTGRKSYFLLGNE